MAIEVVQADAHESTVNALQSDASNSNGLFAILADAAGEWQRVQSELGSSSLAELQLLQAPLYSPDGVMDVYWRTPIFVRNQFTHASKAMKDFFAIWSRTQQRIFAMESVATSDVARQWLSAMSLSNRSMPNRRKTAQVIQFSDRRRA